MPAEFYTGLSVRVCDDACLCDRDLVAKGFFSEAVPYLKNALEYLVVEQRSTPASRGPQTI